MVSRKALGKGLSALIPDKGRVKVLVSEIPLEEISKNRYQPRKKFDDVSIKELAASIKAKGVIQPILVQKADKGYELIAGERRLRAVKLLKLETIPSIIKSINKVEALELAILENIQREDLNPVEEANAYKLLMGEFKLTQEEVARKVGRERSSIANMLRLLKLPASIQADITEGRLTMGHARALLACASETEMMDLRKQILKYGLNVRDVEAKTKKKNGKKKKSAVDPFYRDLSETFRKSLSTKVTIKPKGKGGSILIEYYSSDDLERITEVINKR